MASLDNAESGLCHNVPRSSSEFGAADRSRQSRRCPTSAASSVRAATPGNGNDGNVELDTSTSEQSDTHCSREYDAVSRCAGSTNQERETPEMVTAASAQKTKDPKSLTQNLFDTLSLRMVEWLPLRRSTSDASASASSRRPRRPVSEDARDCTPSETKQARDSGSKSSPRHTKNTSRSVNVKAPHGVRTPSSHSDHRQPPALELKFPGQPVKRVSLEDLEPWRQSPRSGADTNSFVDQVPSRKPSLSSAFAAPGGLPSPPALKHRPQKHRGLEKKSKHRRVSWDGSKVLRDAQQPRRPVDETESVERFPPSPLTSHTRDGSDVQELQRLPTPVQTVTHLSSDIVNALSELLVEDKDTADKWRQEVNDMNSKGGLEDAEWHFATARQRQVFPFVAQSVFYGLSSSSQLLQSFRRNSVQGSSDDDHGQSTVDLATVEPSFRKLFEICPSDLIWNSLWNALDNLFIPPDDLSSSLKGSRYHASRAQTSSTAHHLARSSAALSDAEAAHIGTVSLFALVSSLPRLDPQVWRSIRQIRAAGTVSPDAGLRKMSLDSSRTLVEVTDRFEHDLALRLVYRLVRGLTARQAFHEISKARNASAAESKELRKPSTLKLILDNLHYHHKLAVEQAGQNGQECASLLAPSLIVEWLRTLLLKEWDGKPEMSRSSAAGGAVQILSLMYKERKRLGLEPEDFHTAFLSERLDPMEMPVEWLSRPQNNKTLHLLSTSFLFPPSALVTYFRAMNHATMSKSYETAVTASQHVNKMAFSNTIPLYEADILPRLTTSTKTHLVLVVRRDNILTDALNQLWRREKRELLRPLKVQMGMNEGEEGVDHGGVQQEFFRVLFGQALSPEYGMFTVDPRSHMTWFQPLSMEPLYKYELLGLLMSLAVYNGLTLPVNFPVAFYRKLLGLKVKHLDHIRDGWPELTQGLEELLSWDDGDVGDVFMRTYEFSFEVFGRVVTVDMERVDRDALWPVPQRSSAGDWSRSINSEGSNSRSEAARRARIYDEESGKKDERESIRPGILKGVEYNAPFDAPFPQEQEEARLVTNDNREQFVKDYIFWLTDKSVRPQYEAFARGFYTCLDRTSLSIFTPEALKTVIEGIQEIDMDELERHARYEGGYGRWHPVVQDFWHIVKKYPPEKKARLLEFVTACDRAPVNGVSSIMFVIQKNGEGDEVSFLE